jgi:tetratricopeptide (TPR) repeat protein
VATGLSNLAFLSARQGRYVEAEQLYQRALEIQVKALGPEHPSVALTLNNLAELFIVQGRYADAMSLFRRSLAIREKALGSNHRMVAESLSGLAELLRAQGHYTDAEPFYLRSLEIKTKALGADHPEVATDLINLALLYQKQGRYAEAYQIARNAIASLERRALETDERDAIGLDSEQRSVGYLFTSFLNLASNYANEASVLAAPITAESFEAGQLANVTSADRAVTEMAARVAASTPELGEAAREREDAVNRRNSLNKMLIEAVSKASSERDSLDEQKSRRELIKVEATLLVLDKKLGTEFPRFAQIANPTPLALADAQSLLAPAEALMFLVVSDKAVYRFIVRKDRAEFREIKVGRSALELQIKTLRLGTVR